MTDSETDPGSKNAERQQWNWQKGSFYAVVAILALATWWRLESSFRNNIQVDFLCFVDCARVTFKGLDYQDLNNLTLYHWPSPQIVFPGILVLYLPFSWIDIGPAKLLYFWASVSATVGSYWYFMRVIGLERQVSFRSPTWLTAAYFGGLFLYLHSSPVLMALRLGQSSIWCLWGILLVLTWKSKWSWAAFGVAAVLKYSMFFVLGPLFWVKRYYSLCLVGFAVFLLLSIYPMWLGFNLVDFYGKYLTMLKTEVSTGANSFRGGGYTMVQIEFFQTAWLNLAGKLVSAAAILWVLYRERHSRRIGMNLLLLVSCLTMLVSYHRMHDQVIVMLILTASLSIFLRSRQWWRLLFAVGFCLLTLIPFTAVLHLGDWWGRTFALHHIFILTSYLNFHCFAPLPALTMIAVTVFAAYLYRHENSNDPGFLDTPKQKE